MAVYKNQGSQKLAVYAYDTANDTPKTGDAANITAQISLDGAATAATNDTNPTELDATDAPGIYLFDLTQAETNADLIILSAVSSSTDIVLEPVIVYTTPGDNGALDVNLVQMGGVAQSATDLKDFADAGYDPATNKVQGVVLVDGLTTNNDKTGYSLTPTTGLGNQTADITGSLSGSVGSVTGAVGSVTGSVGGNVTGSVGSVLGGINTSAGTITTLDGLDTAQDTQHSTTQSAISGLNDLSTSDIDARLAAYDGPTNTEMVAAFTEIKGGTWSSSTDTLEAISTQLGMVFEDTNESLPLELSAISAYIDTEVAAIKAVTDAIPDSGAMTSIAQESTVAGLNDISAADVWAAGTRTLTAGTNLSFSTFDPSNDEIESGVTYLQGLRAACAALAGILSGANGSTITIKAIGAAADGTTRITATVDADGNRSAVTLNL